jgi:hypothetical protein
MGKALALTLALVVLAAPPATGLAGPSGKLIAGSEETVLRLHDLPPGYRVGLIGGCGPIEAAGARGEAGDAQYRFLDWAFKRLPEACSHLYKRVFEIPSMGLAAPRVETEVINTPSEEAAAEGFELIGSLFDSDAEKVTEETETLSPSGVQIRIFRFRSFRVDGRVKQPGSILIWRHGKMISYLKVAGLSPRGNDRVGLQLAAIQQWRLEHPSPYTDAEQDDSEVWLDDPAVNAPVYWVGNPFQPARQPAVGLEFSYTGSALPPGSKYELDYFAEGGGFRVEGWTKRSWRRFQRSDLWKLNRADRCTRIDDLRLQHGQAVIFGSYHRIGDGPCPSRSPDRYYAIARIGRMVIGVNLRNCSICPEEGSGLYDTPRGMKTILRSLVLRPKPVYPATP